MDDGDDVGVALSSSVNLSDMVGKSVTKASSADARMSVATRRRLSWVLRSASSLAEVAPTPNTIPAVVGGLMRLIISGIFSLSFTTHCFNKGSQSCLTKSASDEKKRASLKASLISFFQVFWLPGSLESS